ncbi:regulator of chromosome condensation 1/beta-lactamase-inhibitor protein II [Absidia repens]|uniref:Regulator of chromosome condensation 1/beta-lactamase-inhibitor protein II n=1 Tax=Absidia repens TaxID=90262 RepID=A0A1X2IWY7_9FUNG|nr:regulator of chromosome condensation 1/beta-lactamase-inhibitor protein II [Absidia repens]
MTSEDTDSKKLLIFGTTAWDIINRKGKGEKKEEEILLGPNLVRELVDVKVKKAVTGPVSCHSFVITNEGQVWTFGRNERGQLGLGHKDTIPFPVNVSQQIDALKNEKIVAGATGRNHSLLVTAAGEVFAAGDNKLGQLGLSSLTDQTTFQKVTNLGKVTVVDVACGADFSLAIDDKGQIYAFGSMEYGQLGNGADGQYIKSAGQMGTHPQPQPLLVKSLAERKITAIACGANHSLALDDEGYVYSWGFGGLGRLGHGEQKDLSIPKVIPNLASVHELSRATQIACGASCSLALDGNKQMLLWGKWKNTGDGSSGQPWMAPRYLYDLNGWNLRQIAAGGSSLFALADDEMTTIAWGQVQNGELGFGEDSTVKTATKPQKVEPLEGIKPLQVSCGLGHTLLIVKADDELVPNLPKWPQLPETDDLCVKCHKEENDEQLLLCDKCDSPMHTYCADPPLDSIPEGEWYCDTCHPPASSKKRSADGAQVSGNKKSKSN